MKEYSYQEMLKMQAEAADRVREMQKRSVYAVQDAQSRFEQSEEKRIPDNAFSTGDGTKRISMPVEFDRNETPSSENRQETDNAPARKGLLDFLRDDGDSALIIAIMALLCSEETDPSLMMALAYILL